MNWFRIGLLSVVVTLTGCITTTTGDVPVSASSEDAARINMNLGITYLQQGNYEQAMEKLRRSLDEESDNPTAHWALGLVYERLGDPEEARKEFKTAVRQGPDDPEALNQMASFLCRQGDVAGGLKYYDRALAVPLNMSRYSIATNAGICAKQSDLERAERYLRDALSQNPTFSAALYQMADVAYRRENYLQARAFIERRIDSSLPDPEVYLLGYRIELALDNPEAANRYAKRLLAQYPESVEARLVLEAQRDGS